MRLHAVRMRAVSKLAAVREWRRLVDHALGPGGQGRDQLRLAPTERRGRFHLRGGGAGGSADCGSGTGWLNAAAAWDRSSNFVPTRNMGASKLVAVC